jgi:hypothetical protein
LLAPNARVLAFGNFNGQTLTISGLTAGDEIGFAGGVTIAGNAIQIGGTTIGTFTGGSAGADLVVTFNASAMGNQVRMLIANLTYLSTSDNPVSHNLSFDLAGVARTDRVVATRVNDAPVVDLNGAGGGTSATLVYTAGGPLTALAPAATILDVDSANFGGGGSLIVSFSGTGTSDDQLRIITGTGVT